MNQPEKIEKLVTAVQYIGKHGRGHHRAYCSGVGEVYYLQIVEVANSLVPHLPPDEWRLAEHVCRHFLMSGEMCPNLREKDSQLCASCNALFKQRASTV